MSSVHEHSLPNGMTLLCCRQDHLHSLAFGLYLRGGALYENKTTQGVCHLLEHLCFRGLGGLDEDGLNRILDRLGAELDGATYPEGIVFQMRTHPRYFDDALSLFIRFFDGTGWTQEQIDAEKEVVLRQIEAEEEDFDETVNRRFRRTTAGGFPMMGTAESVRAFSRQTLHRWRRLVFQPQNACLCLTGNFSPAMEAAAVEALSELANYTDEPPFSQAVPLGFCMRDSRSDLVTEQEGGQAQVHLAFDLDDDRVFPLVRDVLCAVTGGNDSSLLFQTLREDMALVAEIDSAIESLGMFQRLIIRYEVRQEYLAESLRRVFELLHRLCLYVRPVRLTQTRTQFTENLDFYQDDVWSMNELMGWSWMADDLSRADLDAKRQMFDDLTCEDLLDAAQCIFRPENLTISIERDPAGAPEDLTPLLLELRGMLA